ncbi:MAG TPA: aminotransferase class IV [Vicinamibacterales bacterium]
MRPVVYVNGVVRDARDAVVPVYDHGFLYGEGVYETLRTYSREPFLFDRHFARLRHSAAQLALDLPLSGDDLLARVRATMGAADGPSSEAVAPGSSRPEAYIRILLTRGVGELTYHLAACPVPTLVIIVKPYVAPAERTFTEGIRVSLVRVRRNHPAALDPMIKSNNLLNNALAMQEALRRGADEALMQNQAGEIVECSQSNVFIVRQGALLTPPLEAGLLPGITREFVMELASDLGVVARETPITPAELLAADEVFVTGTTREVTPVVHVDDTRIAQGQPGRLTQHLLSAFRDRVQTLTRSAASSATPA